MKQICILFTALALVLGGCTDTQVPENTSETQVSTVENITETTTVEAEQTTKATEVVSPVFKMPVVVTAEVYEKEAIDKLFGGEFGFTHHVEYPKIDSEEAGAVALNAKIADRYGKIVNELKNGEEKNYLYNIKYVFSGYSETVCIRITEYVGWQYSESTTTQTVYYYDALNDKEISAEEYASIHGIDLEKAKENVAFSYELASIYYEDESVIVSDEIDAKNGSPEPLKLYPAKQATFDFDFNGLEVTDGEVTLYYGGQMYTYHVYEFALDRFTLEPKNPHYSGYVLPNDSEGDIKINFENGKVTSYSLPKNSGIDKVTVTSSRIIIEAHSQLNYSIMVNGEKYNLGDSMYDPSSGYYRDVFFASKYVPANEIKTVEIISQ